MRVCVRVGRRNDILADERTDEHGYLQQVRLREDGRVVGGIRRIIDAQRVVQVSLGAQGFDDVVREREAGQADPRVLAVSHAVRNLLDGCGVRSEQLPANKVAAN